MKKNTLCLLLATGILLPNMTQANSDSFSYDDWRQILAEFVDEEGFVDYAGLALSREPLDRFVDQVRQISPHTHPALFPTRDAELAYYINAYNALVFAGVLKKGPQIRGVWGMSGTGYGFFVGMKVVLGGRKTNLKKLEDDQIRAAFADPRIHAALNCASTGCPRLPREIFSPENLDRELDAAMAEFVSDPRHCRVDPEARTVALSKIFDWFKGDFLHYERENGNADPKVLDYINRYRAEDARIPRDYTVKVAKYDKSLNRQR